MKVFSRSRYLLFVLAVIVLSACNYAAPADVPSPQPSRQQLSTQTVPKSTAEHQVFIPAIQSQSGKTPQSDQGNIPQTFDPHVDIQVNNASIKVGDTLVLVARPVDISAPIYSLLIRDEGVQDAPPAANVTFENKVTALENSSKVLEFISAEGQPEQATFFLRATAAGTTTVTIEASGEIHGPDADQATVNGSGMGSVLITVVN